jgi:hypothetical protein
MRVHRLAFSKCKPPIPLKTTDNTLRHLLRVGCCLGGQRWVATSTFGKYHVRALASHCGNDDMRERSSKQKFAEGAQKTSKNKKGQVNTTCPFFI